jgi:hypothetical protein
MARLSPQEIYERPRSDVEIAHVGFTGFED